MATLAIIDLLLSRVMNAVFGKLFPPRVAVSLECTCSGYFGPPMFSREAERWASHILAVTLLSHGEARILRVGVVLPNGEKVFAGEGDFAEGSDLLPVVLRDGHEIARFRLKPDFAARAGLDSMVPFAEFAGGRVAVGMALPK